MREHGVLSGTGTRVNCGLAATADAESDDAESGERDDDDGTGFRYGGVAVQELSVGLPFSLRSCQQGECLAVDCVDVDRQAFDRKAVLARVTSLKVHVEAEARSLAVGKTDAVSRLTPARDALEGDGQRQCDCLVAVRIDDQVPHTRLGREREVDVKVDGGQIERYGRHDEVVVRRQVGGLIDGDEAGDRLSENRVLSLRLVGHTGEGEDEGEGEGDDAGHVVASIFRGIP